MANRIRYEKTKIEGVYKSKQIFVSATTGARYKVVIDTNNKIYKIMNVLKQMTIAEGGEKINNINVLKDAAKKRLQKLGVRFEDEMRNRTFGLCEKGYSQEKHKNKETENNENDTQPN